MPASTLTRLCLVAAALPLLAACPARGGDAADDGTARMDTTNENPLDGLSAEQLERQAEPLTPEQAGEMGMVDTTIHLEQHAVDDTLLPQPPRPSVPPADTIQPLGEPRP